MMLKKQPHSLGQSNPHEQRLQRVAFVWKIIQLREGQPKSIVNKKNIAKINNTIELHCILKFNISIITKIQYFYTKKKQLY